MKFLLTIIILTIVSCGKADENEQQPAFFKEYISFYSDAKDYGCRLKKIEIYFAKFDDYLSGLCIYDLGVFLNKSKWMQYKKYEKLQLMYHELGHCAMRLEHGDGIMNYYVFTEKEIEPNWNEWKNQFFAQCTNKQVEN